MGKALTKSLIYYWIVRAWDKNGKSGLWSQVSRWETGLIGKQNWQAKWIGNDLTALGKGEVFHLPPAPYFRKQVNLNEELYDMYNNLRNMHNIINQQYLKSSFKLKTAMDNWIKQTSDKEMLFTIK